MACEFTVQLGIGVIGEACGRPVVGLALGPFEAPIFVLVEEEGVDAGNLRLLLQVSRVHNEMASYFACVFKSLSFALSQLITD